MNLASQFNAVFRERYAFVESQHPRDKAGEFSARPGLQRLPGTVSPLDADVPKPLEPLPGQRSLFAEQVNDAFNLAMGIKPAPARQLQKALFARFGDVARYRVETAEGRWITIGGGEEGGGTHIKVKGNRVTAGPPGLKGDKLDELDSNEKPKDHGDGFQLKSDPAENPNPNKSGQKELPLSAHRKSGPALENVGDLHVDPERFQYKLNTRGKSGVTDQFSDIKFNPEFAGTIHVWHDTADGKTYVVNGHHRHELAERSGYQGKMQVHYLEAENAEQARAKGALINIAGGNGTAIDAAKFMRDTGTTPDEMKQHGVSLKGQVAKDAATLSGLSNGIFRRLALGTYRTGRALAIAQHLPNHEDQDRLDKWIDNYEDTKNRELSDSTVDEMAREAGMASRQTQTTKGLFGEETDDKSLFVERAELKGAMRRDIAGRLNKFRAVATDKAASVLEGANTINAGENAKAADRLANFLDDFDRETSYRGPVSDRLNQAAQELAREPRKRKQIIDSLTGDIRKLLETVPEADPGAAGGLAEGSGDAREPGQPIRPAAGQKGFFARQFDREFERAIYGRAGLTERMNRELYRLGFVTERYGFVESDHPRGQPENAGEFVARNDGATGSSVESLPKNTEDALRSLISENSFDDKYVQRLKSRHKLTEAQADSVRRRLAEAKSELENKNSAAERLSHTRESQAAVVRMLLSQYGEPSLSGRSSAIYFRTPDGIQIRVADHAPVHSRSVSHVNVVTGGDSHPSWFASGTEVIDIRPLSREGAQIAVALAVEKWRSKLAIANSGG